MDIYETRDGKGGWRGNYAIATMAGNPRLGWRGQYLWVPIKKRLWWWVRDKSRSQFWDWPTMFRKVEGKEKGDG